LLRNLPSDTGMAFVLVQHLDPHHASILAELLANYTRMPVLQVHGDVPVKPDNVYVIPPNATMVIGDGVLRVSRPAQDLSYQRRPIDAFFVSLAANMHHRAIGVVLSGAASDGTQGLKAIKAEGGITFAQNDTAKFDGMPRSAIAAGVVDFVLAPRSIAQELAALANHLISGSSAEELFDDSRAMDEILAILRRRTGIDFRLYKVNTIHRRLARRMALQKTETLADYLGLLGRDSGETDALFDDLLIKVTEFFRDGLAFEALKQQAFVSLIKDSENEPLRIWVPGCSTGEEVYSIGICLLEFLEASRSSRPVLMFGTDASERVIERARSGIYDEAAISTVSPERLNRFFTRSDSGYQINRNIRGMCVFSRHVLGVDPPLSRMHLISCRNLLIYFGAALQRRVIDTLAYALRPSGCLLVGPSENTGRLSEFFDPLNDQHRMYLKRPSVEARAFALMGELAPRPEQAALLPPTPASETHPSTRSVHVAVDHMLLSHYGPSGIVVDKHFKIVEFRGNMNPYLHIPEGDANLDLLKCVRDDLAVHLQSAISEAHEQNATIRLEEIQVRRDSAFHFVRITVFPVSIPSVDRYSVILFEGLSDPAERTRQPASSDELETSPPDLERPERHIEHLERELRSTREYLQTTIEELRATNEEVQSANEELQSNNEELQTTKEELQASNEELATMNGEIQARNVELGALNDDLVNLLAAINTPIVMVGNDLCIRRFTPAAESLFPLRSIDIGRPISDFKPLISVLDLGETLRGVLDTLKMHDQEVQDSKGNDYLMRVRPYRTGDNRIDGAVLTLTDITDLKRSMDEIRRARDYASAIVDTVREPLVVLDEKLAVRSGNRSFYETFRQTPQQVEGRGVYEIVDRQLDRPPLRELLSRILAGESQLRDVEIEHELQPAGRHSLLVNARVMGDGLILVAFADITERKRAAEAEARYRLLFESARDGIVIVDEAGGEILDVNPYAEQLFGYNRRELVGQRLWDIEPARDTPALRAAVGQTRDRGAAGFPDMTLKTKDGRAIQAEIIGNVYQEGDRRAIQLNIRDLTERRKFERELLETQKLESLGLLAGGVAHDFNNLISGIIVNAELVSSDMSVDNPSRTHLRAIANASLRAAKLTQQLMAYTGKGRFITEDIDLSELIRDTLPLIQTSIPKTVDVRLDLPPDLPLVPADAGQMQQLVMNLMINAGEAVGVGTSGRVEIRTGYRELTAVDIRANFTSEALTPGKYVWLEVKDTGSGMDEATKAKIFDPFFTTKFAGRGLGLAAIAGILRSLRGAIRVYSTPGHGSTFYVLLPAVMRPSGPGQAKPVVKRRRGSGTILVIDDEAEIRQGIGAVLEKSGFAVLAAENGQVGVDIFKKQNGLISLVILDLTMPVMGGEQAFDLLRAIRPDVPVLLISGYGESDAVARIADKDFAGFLQKPFEVDRLIETVASALGMAEE
jgi:two-component system, chemotaxis family, CheB/CheR fusion protein